MPVGGDVLEINAALDDSPELVNKDPYGQAWFVRIRIADAAELAELMDAAAYETFVAGLEH
jgi:glycine cleavage system H protein